MQQRTIHPLALCVLATACTIKAGDLGELTDVGDDTSSSGAPATGDDTGDDTTGIVDPTTGADTSSGETTGSPDTDTGPAQPASGVDVLFIIDNSGSMAQAQQRLGDAIEAFSDPLVAAGLDLRIAVTTTDLGNPRCQSTTPESGALVLESCRARVALGEFETVEGDVSAACLDICPHEAVAVAPTATDQDPTPAPRPWIEWSPDATNLEVPLSEALACALPQGVVGCGFEQPLEALHRAITRMHTTGDPSEGFLRPHAHFVAVVVTDETDCSYNPDHDDIFIANKAFWWDQDDPAPTSSLCWAAGVACSGGPGTYDDCPAADHGPDGALTDDPAQAVLHPVARYDDVLDALQAEKLDAGSAAQVQLVVVGGVPVGWPQNPLVFADSPDPDYMSKFGIGPGCSDGDRTAAPPGRLREVAAAHAPLVQPMFSICNPDLAGPLAVLAASLVGG